MTAARQDSVSVGRTRPVTGLAYLSFPCCATDRKLSGLKNKTIKQRANHAHFLARGFSSSEFGCRVAASSAWGPAGLRSSRQQSVLTCRPDRGRAAPELPQRLGGPASRRPWNLWPLDRQRQKERACVLGAPDVEGGLGPILTSSPDWVRPTQNNSKSTDCGP